jgi:hypothetical protein
MDVLKLIERVHVVPLHLVETEQETTTNNVIIMTHQDHDGEEMVAIIVANKSIIYFVEIISLITTSNVMVTKIPMVVSKYQIIQTVSLLVSQTNVLSGVMMAKCQ